MSTKSKWASLLIVLLSQLSLYAQPGTIATWQDLHERASRQLENGRWQLALATASQAEVNVKKEVGTAGPEYAEVLNLLTLIQLPMGRLDGADSSTSRLWELSKTLMPMDKLRLARAGKARSELLLLLERPAEAALVAREAIDAVGGIGESARLMPGLIQALVLAYLKMEAYEAAAAALEESLEIVVARPGSNSPDYALLLRARGQLYYLTDRFEQARASLEEAEVILKRSPASLAAELAETLNWKGACYLYQAGYVTARKSFETAISIWEKIGAAHHPNYAQVLENLGLVYAEGLANFARAEECYQQALMINQGWSEQGIRTAQSLGNLSMLFLTIGDEQQSLNLGRQAVHLLERQKQVRAYATALNNLGRIYARLDSLEQAENLYQQAITIYLSRYSPLTVRHATFLSNLGAVHELLENYETAEAEYRQAIEIIVEVLGQENPYYAAFINNLAILYDFQGNPETAREYYQQVEAIDRRVLGPQHPRYIRTLYNIAGFHHYYEEPEAMKYYVAANEGQVVLLNRVYATFDEASRLFYLKRARQDFDQYLSFALSDTASVAQAAQIQSLLLATKGLALEYSMAPREEQASSGDTSLNQTFSEWKQASQRLSDAFMMTAWEREKQNIRIDQLEQVVATLEKQLSRNTNIFQQAGVSPNSVELQEKLSEDEATVDFFRFNFFDGEIFTDSMLYCALVQRSLPARPILIPLASEQELQQLLGNSYGGAPSYIQYPQLGHLLYQKIWAPLAPHLQGAETIYLCADGLLHNVAFAALPGQPDGKQRILDQHRIYQYSTFRDLWDQERKPLNSSAALFGGADYLEVPAGNPAKPYFLPLPGTRTEVDSIRQLLLRQGWTVDTFTGSHAGEGELRALSGSDSPGILHCATHGFFFGLEKAEGTESMQERLAASPNPLQRSGLAFAGANESWAAPGLSPSEADGILTALELSTLQFPGTQLAVLSACDTGLGDVEATEGVFGLQRALKKTGIRQLLLSLWKVNDAAAPAFMALFYRHLKEGANIGQAFFETQTYMSQRYPPSDWAGFVLLY